MYLKRSIRLCDQAEDDGKAKFEMLLYDSYADYCEGAEPFKNIGWTYNYEVAEKLEYLFNVVASRNDDIKNYMTKRQDFIYTNIYHAED